MVINRMNKRGLSDVITSVLIIVLVIAAVVVLWTFVRPTIQKGAESVEAANCFQLDLQPVSCVVNSDNVTANVTYKWISGSADLSDVRLVLGKADGSADSISGGTIEPLETKLVTNISFGGIPEEFSVAAVIKVPSGAEQTCPQAQPVICS